MENETTEQNAQIEEKTRTKNTMKTLQGSVTQEEKNMFFNKCKAEDITPSQKVKELCMKWVNQ